MKLSAIALVILFFISTTDSAKILGIVPAPSYSHQVLLRPIWRELSLRGHQLTILTTNPMNDPTLSNLTEIDIGVLYDVVREINFSSGKITFLTLLKLTLEYINKICEPILAHPAVENLIQNKSEHFDLVMVEAYFPAMYIFSERFASPFIGLTTLESGSRNYEILGNPIHPILYPEPMLHSINLNFWERLVSIFTLTVSQVIQDYIVIPQQQTLVDQHFGKNYPRLHEIERKMTMLFTNTDLVFHPRRPVLPNVIRIGGGTHLKPSKPLPEKLKQILDDAKQGVVYFSLGSNVKSKELTVETQQIFLETFAELPYLVLWKFELDGKETPKNVVTSKWFPQQDIFEHSNVRLFITQGGLQSMEEAVYNSIPMVGIPFFGDQSRNMRVISEKGMGIYLELDKLTKESFKSAILEVIENPRYRNQVEKWAKIAKDEPMTGLEKAVWWTEYVIRHQGAPHFRRNEIPWYQYYLLDVIGFCLIVVFVIVFLIVIFTKLSIKIFKYFFVKQKVKTQ